MSVAKDIADLKDAIVLDFAELQDALYQIRDIVTRPDEMTGGRVVRFVLTIRDAKRIKELCDGALDG